MNLQFQRLDLQFDVAEAISQVDQHPELWDVHTARKTPPCSPHAQMSDIWIRYRNAGELTEPSRYAEAHLSEWYPAARVLPALRPIIFRLMAHVQGVQLGGILITKLPPGCEILPHHDQGTWHAHWYNCKVYVPLRTNDRVLNICEDATVIMAAGEAWRFDNLRVHSVENRHDTEERVSLIVCIRCEP